MDEGSDLFPPVEPDEHALARRIVSEHEAYCAAATDALEHAIACGRFLIEAKAKPDIGHRGAWLPWVESNCGLSARVAQMYMRIARSELARLSPDAKRVSHLSMRAAIKALASPKALAKALGDDAKPEAESLAESSARRVGQGLPASVLKKMYVTKAKRTLPIKNDVVSWLNNYRLGADAALAWFRQASTVQRLQLLDDLMAALSEAEMDEHLTNPRLRARIDQTK